MPWSRDLEVDPAAVGAGPHRRRSSRRSEYFTALSSRLATADTSWRRSPTTVSRRGRRSSTSMRDAPLLGRRAHPVGGLGHAPGARATGRRAAGLVAASMRHSSSRSSMVRPTRNASLAMPLGQPPGHRRGRPRRAASRPAGQRADRRLQLVADVGDEVAAHGLEPAPLGDVLDDDQRPEGRAAVVQRHGRDAQDAPGRAEQLELPRGRRRPRRRRPRARLMASSTRASLWRAARNVAAGSLR